MADYGMETKEKLSQKATWTRMLVLAVGYMATGTAYSAPGPSLLDLEIRTSSSTQEISLMFSFRAAGALLGSLICGYLYDILNADILLASVEALGAVCIIVAPWWQHYVGLSVFIGLTGFFAAMANVGIIAYCVTIWGPKNPPYVLLLAFINSAVSSSVAPIVRALLLPKTSPTEITASLSNSSNLFDNTSSTLNFTIDNNSGGDVNATRTQFLPSDVKVQYAFLMPGALFTLACIGHICIALSRGCTLKTLPKVKVKNTENTTSSAHTERLTKSRRIILFILFGIIAVNLGSISETYLMYIFSFSVKYLDWTKKNAAWTMMAVGTANYVGQVSFIVISKLLRSRFVMGLIQGTMLISAILMCLPIINIAPVFWISIILCGLAFGPLGPTIVSWMSHIFGPSGKVTSFHFIVLYMARIGISYLMGYLFDNKGPIWFVYINIITVGLSSIAYIAILALSESGKPGGESKQDYKEHDPTTKPMINGNSCIEAKEIDDVI